MAAVWCNHSFSGLCEATCFLASGGRGVTAVRQGNNSSTIDVDVIDGYCILEYLVSERRSPEEYVCNIPKLIQPTMVTCWGKQRGHRISFEKTSFVPFFGITVADLHGSEGICLPQMTAGIDVCLT